LSKFVQILRIVLALGSKPFVYGRMLAESRGVTPDLSGARAWLRAFIDGQLALAEMLLNGRGGERNTEQAIALFGKAAAKNHSGAMFALGAIFAAGRYVAADSQTAQRWFRVAAERGHGHAQSMLGRFLLHGDAGDLTVEGRMWLERAVAQGITEAEHDLALAPAPVTVASN
jgi:TPR repeat protein